MNTPVNSSPVKSTPVAFSPMFPVDPKRAVVIAVTSAWPDFWVDDSEMHTYALFDAIKAKLKE